ncbi:MAG: selenium cofactor biosynthesis protein YqeC [Termitinemataceae bacterium]|nr:MAG: selenium cofactor biosynthesis protein YqeC [Termitinemataceae bacterium]
MTLKEYFDRFVQFDRSDKKVDVISIVGCGGKTSLMWSLSSAYKTKKVLVSTTTHIQKPPASSGLYNQFLSYNEGSENEIDFECRAPCSGVTLSLSYDTNLCKYKSLPLESLESFINHFDLCILEADGSRSKPIKGWADYEPVIIKRTTITVGILPVNAVGLSANEENVHRLPLFLKLSGAQENSPITVEHIAKTISSSTCKSLFSASEGQKILFISQVNSSEKFKLAEQIISGLPLTFKNQLDGIIFGCLKTNTIFV